MSAATEGQSGLAAAWMRGVESGDAREASISRSATCVAAWCLLDVARLMAPERHRARGGAGGMEQPLGSGRGAEGLGQLPPRAQPGEGRRQMQDDAAHGALDPDGDLEQPLPQRAHLRGGAGGRLRAPPEQLEDRVPDLPRLPPLARADGTSPTGS